jgi:hypothetical protein
MDGIQSGATGRPNLRISYSGDNPKLSPPIRSHQEADVAHAVAESRADRLARRLDQGLAHRLAGIRAALSSPQAHEPARTEGVRLDILV